jgi:hypothetical protein
MIYFTEVVCDTVDTAKLLYEWEEPPPTTAGLLGEAFVSSFW